MLSTGIEPATLGLWDPRAANCATKALLHGVQSIPTGSVAERSKALDSSSSLFGGVGSNPTWTICIFFQTEKKQKKLLVGESNPGRLRDRQKCYQLHQPGCWMQDTFCAAFIVLEKKNFFFSPCFKFFFRPINRKLFHPKIIPSRPFG